MLSCLDAEELHLARAAGPLAASDEAALAAHIVACADCRAFASDIDAVEADLGDLFADLAGCAAQAHGGPVLERVLAALRGSEPGAPEHAPAASVPARAIPRTQPAGPALAPGNASALALAATPAFAARRRSRKAFVPYAAAAAALIAASLWAAFGPAEGPALEEATRVAATTEAPAPATNEAEALASAGQPTPARREASDRLRLALTDAFALPQ